MLFQELSRPRGDFFLSFLHRMVIRGLFGHISFRGKLDLLHARFPSQQAKLSLLWITPVFFRLRHHSLLCHVTLNHLGKECKFPSSESGVRLRQGAAMFVSGSLL